MLAFANLIRTRVYSLSVDEISDVYNGALEFLPASTIYAA